MTDQPIDRWPDDASPETTVQFGAIPASDTEETLEGEAQEVIASLPTTSALLVVQRGPNEGARFLLDQDRTSVGRRESADIFLDDVTVSRKHAEFVRQGSDFLVRDVGSLNGTYVNRERIDATALRPGDEVQVGKYRMIFYPGDQAQQGDVSA